MHYGVRFQSWTFILCSILLIHSADPQTRPVVIIIFEQIYVRTSVPTFQIIAKQNKRHVKIVVTTGETVGLAEGIIDDICIVNWYI